MRRRLFWAIFGVAAGVIVLLLFVTTAGLGRLREQATRNELERAGEVIAELSSERLGEGDRLGALLRGQPVPGLSDDLSAIRRAAGGSDLGFVAITPEGEILGRRPVRDLPLDTDRLLAGEATFASVARPNAGDVLLHARPLGQFGPRNMTAVVVLAREAPVDFGIPRPLLFGALAVVAVLAALVAGSLSRGLSRRLDAVASAAASVAGGDLTARADVPGDDEVALLAASFNRMAERLEESRERERQFLLAVGHDLRTPLTTIAGYAEALQEGLDEPAELARISGVLGVEAARLGRLIEDVTLLARLESSEYTLRPEPVEVEAHIEDLLGPFRNRAADVGVHLREELEQVGLRVVDPDRLGQILANLLENALRYTPEGGTVRVGLGAVGEEVALVVGDTGPGIEPEDLPHVFDRFYVARRYRGIRPEGSGLGLSIVRHLAEAMGGRVEARSEPGSGTEVVVTLPAPPVD